MFLSPGIALADGIDDDEDGYCEDATCSGAALPGDCDDTDDTIHPGANEVCDGFDNDCDGTRDDHPTDGTPYGYDCDGDGVPAESAPFQAIAAGSCSALSSESPLQRACSICERSTSFRSHPSCTWTWASVPEH
jgi:hypothetical protein